MIRVHVDESHAFDMLSVLEIKEDEDAFNILWRDICSEIGVRKTDKIRKSVEYKELLIINQRLFNLIDHMKTEEGCNMNARFVDSVNYQRFLAKKKIQEKFFKKNIMIEKKFGYE